MRYLILLIVELSLIAGSIDTDLEKITPWLLGINFSVAIFSVNFTFFGYQLSKYKSIYTEVTNRQRLNIILLLTLPFLPVALFLFAPGIFGVVALWILPVLVFSAFDNAELTSSYLDPQKIIRKNLSNKSISKYLSYLSREVEKEASKHEAYLANRDKFQIPSHGYDFEPGTLGIEYEDLWDFISVLAKVSIDNHDYPVFRSSINAALKLAFASYGLTKEGENNSNYKLQNGLNYVTRNRLRSVINSVADVDSGGVFLQSLSSELCDCLTQDNMLKDPCSEIARMISLDAVWMGKRALESKASTEPLKVLNTIHRVAELSIHRLEKGEREKASGNLDRYNISAYAYDVKSLGVAALNSDNSHFAYRCMETLSYLGCNAAKLKSNQMIVAVLESIVQIGRVARNLKIGCFWSRCLIPAESHAEEFMGHILTWLIQDISSGGEFYMRGYAEQAYSRLRGVKCVIKPKANFNPKFWIEELKKNGENIAHVERESGMWGYEGEMDYSDFSNLKEYILHGIGSESKAEIFRSTPMPIALVDDDSDPESEV